MTTTTTKTVQDTTEIALEAWLTQLWVGKAVKQINATLPEAQKYVGRVSTCDEVLWDEKGRLHIHTIDGVWCPAALLIGVES